VRLVTDEPHVPSLRTERLLLRGWQEPDLDPFAAMNADSRVSEFLPNPLTREESDALVARIVSGWKDQGFGLWAIERLKDGAFLGFTGLSRPRFEAGFTPAVEIGWRLTVDAWGRGYATEAAEIALTYGFEELGLDEIVSFTVPDNARSRAVMERIGMSRDPADDFEHPGLPDGHPLRRHVLYRLSADAWRARFGLDEGALERADAEARRLAELRSMHDFGALRRRLLARLRTELGPGLRQRGFKGTLPHLHRVRGSHVDLLMIQVDRYGGGFTLDLGRSSLDSGAAPSSMRFINVPSEHQARLTRDPTGWSDRWFRYDGPDGAPEAQQDEAIGEIGGLLDHAERWWREGRGGPHVTLMRPD